MGPFISFSAVVEEEKLSTSELPSLLNLQLGCHKANFSYCLELAALTPI